MKNSVKAIAFAAACAASALMPSLASASVVTVAINQSLPHSGSASFSVDGDATADIGLAENCCSPNSTFVFQGGSTGQWQFAWLSMGQVVDGSLAWVSGTAGYTPTAPLLPGLNYLALRNPSIGNYYGYMTIDFELPTVSTGGYSQTLKSYTYDNTGAAVTVASPRAAAVPEPASLSLLGLGLLGLVGAARRKKAVQA